MERGEHPICQCGAGRMKLRIAKTAANYGRYFYTCPVGSQHPRCFMWQDMWFENQGDNNRPNSGTPYGSSGKTHKRNFSRFCHVSLGNIHLNLLNKMQYGKIKATYSVIKGLRFGSARGSRDHSMSKEVAFCERSIGGSGGPTINYESFEAGRTVGWQEYQRSDEFLAKLDTKNTVTCSFSSIAPFFAFINLQCSLHTLTMTIDKINEHPKLGSKTSREGSKEGNSQEGLSEHHSVKQSVSDHMKRAYMCNILEHPKLGSKTSREGSKEGNSQEGLSEHHSVKQSVSDHMKRAYMCNILEHPKLGSKTSREGSKEGNSQEGLSEHHSVKQSVSDHMKRSLVRRSNGSNSLDESKYPTCQPTNSPDKKNRICKIIIEIFPSVSRITANCHYLTKPIPGRRPVVDGLLGDGDDEVASRVGRWRRSVASISQRGKGLFVVPCPDRGFHGAHHLPPPVHGDVMVPFQALLAYISLYVSVVCPGKKAGEIFRTAIHDSLGHQISNGGEVGTGVAEKGWKKKASTFMIDFVKLLGDNVMDIASREKVSIQGPTLIDISRRSTGSSAHSERIKAIGFSTSASSSPPIPLNRKPDIDPFDPRGKILSDICGDIELRDVRFSYPARPTEEIFSGFSLFIPRGTITALVEPHSLEEAKSAMEVAQIDSSRGYWYSRFQIDSVPSLRWHVLMDMLDKVLHYLFTTNQNKHPIKTHTQCLLPSSQVISTSLNSECEKSSRRDRLDNGLSFTNSFPLANLLGFSYPDSSMANNTENSETKLKILELIIPVKFKSSNLKASW
ncbi:hypothetical protein DH2020_014153 [Rehmannia glutinosa]|uniref:GRF-type domain-containing protein n=1 Tax=Rehmannia glutinosa TaxID=99300 RepID=A0ABR0WX36_REHGL